VASKYFSLNLYVRKFKQFYFSVVFKLKKPVLVTSEIADVRVRFLVSSNLEYRLRAQQSYTREPLTLEWIDQFIGADDVVFDVGANVGAYSLLIGKKMARGRGQVYAFEPESANYAALNRNIGVNSLADKVLALPLAVGRRCTVNRLHLSSIEPGAALHGLGEPVSEGFGFEPAYTQGAIEVSIDQIVSQFGCASPHHVKIDVDGGELGVLKGMFGQFTTTAPRSLMIEVNDDADGEEVRRLMSDLGYVELKSEQWQRKNTFNVIYLLERSEVTRVVS